MGKGAPSTVTQVTSREPTTQLQWWMNNVFADPEGKGLFQQMYNNYLMNPDIATQTAGQYLNDPSDPSKGFKSRVAGMNDIQNSIADMVAGAVNPATGQRDITSGLFYGQMAGVNKPVQDALLGMMGRKWVQDPGGDPTKGHYEDSMTGATKAMNSMDPYNVNLQQTAEGAYLNPSANSELAAYVEAAQRPIINQYAQDVGNVNTSAAQAGRVGSGYNAALMSNAQQNRNQALSDTAARIYAPAYESERGRMVQAQQGGANMWGNMANAANQNMLGASNAINQNTLNSWDAVSRLGGIGDAFQRQNQAQITDQAQAPWRYWNDMLQNVVNPIMSFSYGSPYGSSFTTQQGAPSPTGLQNALGGAALAGSIANAIGAFQ